MGAHCVVLDIGGVLERTSPTGWPQWWERAYELAPGDLLARLGPVLRAGSLGQLTEDEVTEAVGERLGLRPACAAAFVEDLWTEYLGTLNAPLFDWFRGLRPRHRTGILSNSLVGAREREQERYGFADAADVVVHSYEVGLAKPDPEVFRLAAQWLGTAADEVVLLDDVPDAVAGARAAGWQAVLYRDNEQAIADVESLLSH